MDPTQPLNEIQSKPDALRRAVGIRLLGLLAAVLLGLAVAYAEAGWAGVWPYLRKTSVPCLLFSIAWLLTFPSRRLETWLRLRCPLFAGLLTALWLMLTTLVVTIGTLWLVRTWID